MAVTKDTLRILAALTWYSGGAVLALKGGILLAEANHLSPNQEWIWLAAAGGISLGILKARYIFINNCERNLERIASLTEPRIWQFYRPGFFLFLTLMIIAGATLSTLSHGSYSYLISLAIVDISIATALLGSSYIFWR